MSEEVFDLDAARIAQADKSQKPLPFRFGGKVYEIARPLSYKAVFAFAERNHAALLPALFGEQVEDLVEAGINPDDVMLLIGELLGGPGKSNSSSGSRPAGRRSKSTSKSTTGSTRRKSPPADS